MASRTPRSRIPAAQFSHDADAFLREHAPDAEEGSLALGMLLVRAANSYIQSSEREVLRPRGLRWAGFSALFILRIYRSLEASALSRLAGVSRQAASIMLSGLQKEGLIERAEPASDRRIVPMRLAESGEKVADETLDAELERSQRWFASLTPRERAELNRLLEKVLVGESGRS
jgi:Transcriptional regulators